ncbi:family 1 glycosylhydrolase [Streptomyces bobili]|uniref:family 1 glycosylhydrolase n=1 Tax=Streptomyces bobili TaxID=67280 RepID=UPI0033A17D9B
MREEREQDGEAGHGERDRPGEAARREGESHGSAPENPQVQDGGRAGPLDEQEGGQRHGPGREPAECTPSLFREPSGPACRGYQQWETDLDLVAGLGLNAVRFSVEWARIEPERGVVSAEALDHYERKVDGCLARGLAPLVTFSHFTAPHWFAAAGSWTAADAPGRFADQCARVMAPLRRPNRLRRHPQRTQSRTAVAGGREATGRGEALEARMLVAAARAAGTDTYASANVIPVDRQDEFQEAFTRAHRAAREAIKASRGDSSARPSRGGP